RKAFILSDCDAGWVVTLSARELPVVRAQRVDLDAIDLSGIELNQVEHAELRVRLPGASRQTAYIMYTSGSTGRPKGVKCPHRAIARLVLNNGYAQFGVSDRVAFAANPAFDASTMEVWAALLNGGCSVVVDRTTVLQPRQLQQFLQGQRISVLWLSAG